MPDWEYYIGSYTSSYGGYSYSYSYSDYNGNGSSIFQGTDRNYSLAPPLLNINTPPLTVSFADRLMNRSIIEGYGVCQANKTYQWGFSIQLTFGFLLATLSVASLLGMQWVSIAWYEDDEFAYAIFGHFRTALVVSDALVETVGDDSMRMSDRGLQTAMRDQQGGIFLTGKRYLPADDGEVRAMYRRLHTADH